MESSQTLSTIDINDNLAIQIYQDSSIVEGGGIIWDGAQVFTHFIAKHPKGFAEYFKLDPQKIERPLQVLELGAGTGYVGLTFAKLMGNKSQIILTEMSAGCLALMDQNIQVNQLESKVQIKHLLWGIEEAKKLKVECGEEFDFLFGSDVVYEAKYFEVLVETIIELSTTKTCTILVCTDHGNLNLFMDFINGKPFSDKISVTTIGNEWLDEVFQSDDIKVLLIQLKS